MSYLCLSTSVLSTITYAGLSRQFDEIREKKRRRVHSIVTGHVPTTQFQYGETFGNATAKYFQDYRSEALNSSKSLYARGHLFSESLNSDIRFRLPGGYFPTPYTHQPELVMSDRRRSRDQYLYVPKYSLNNTNVDRTNEIRKFYQVIFRTML